MKKFISILLLSLCFCSTVHAEETTIQATATGRASSVFLCYTAAIHPSYFGGDCSLLGEGKGSVQIILQRQDSVNGWWFMYNSQNYTKNFSNTSVCSFSKSYILPAGTFRCKTVVSATLDGHSDTKTVISPELTLY